MSASYNGYGHTYLTSYGWTGSGNGLRKGAIDKPLAIPPKKNLSGLGNDRDEAFPFWDHLFAAASKAINIKISSDDEDDPSSYVASGSAPLTRTATGIISNRRPTLGAPASASGSITPNFDADADAPGRLSLVSTAKREAARRNLYSRFFRGPVLGPDDDRPAPHSPPSSCASPPASAPVSKQADTQDNAVDEMKNGKKQRSQDGVETKEERRERKRLKKQRKAARAAKKAEKALAKEKAKEKKGRSDCEDQEVQKS